MVVAKDKCQFIIECTVAFEVHKASPPDSAKQLCTHLNSSLTGGNYVIKAAV